mmetsp:Transcript_36060/g.64483  ORF Transcript_36060/g.64483 Transcript_36060/m.64483 type:complete len:202 (-) Transcript_36060:765-1370(-)
MQRLRLTIAYDGTNYSGFQLQSGQLRRQEEGGKEWGAVASVQGVVEEALGKVLKLGFASRAVVVGSSRYAARRPDWQRLSLFYSRTTRRTIMRVLVSSSPGSCTTVWFVTGLRGEDRRRCARSRAMLPRGPSGGTSRYRHSGRGSPAYEWGQVTGAWQGLSDHPLDAPYIYWTERSVIYLYFIRLSCPILDFLPNRHSCTA